MKNIRHPSVIPIYTAGGIWLLCCLFLPMYQLWHYLLYGVITLGGYFLMKRFFPGTVEEVELPQAPPDSGDPEVDALIEKGRGQLEQLHTLGTQSPSLRQQAQGENITSTMEKIQDMLAKVETAFQKQLDNLYENQAMDVTADIQVMQRMMESEGLLAESQKFDING